MAASAELGSRDVDVATGKASPPMERATSAAPSQIEVGHRDGGAGAGQTAGDRFADAGGRAGDDRRLPGKVESIGGYSSFDHLTVISTR